MSLVFDNVLISFLFEHYFGYDTFEAEALTEYVENSKDYDNFDLLKWHSNTDVYVLNLNNLTDDDVDVFKENVGFNEDDDIEYVTFYDKLVIEILS